MSTEVTLPALGESVTEGTVSRWLKAVGDTVEADEPLLEVSTDKVDTEVPSPASGTLLEIKVPEDEDAEVGAVLAIIGDPSTAESAPEPAEKAEPEPVKSKAEKAPAPAPAPSATPAPASPKPAGSARKASQEVSPEAAALRGTTEKMSRLRKVIASRMVESLQVSAQLTATVEVDMTAISRIRKAEKAAFKAREGVGLSYLPFITKAVVEALKANPKFNANIDTEAGTITYGASENIGIAVDTPRGLLVPVIKNAGDLNIAGLAHQIGDLAARTRDNKVTPDELAGGTFTITNYGSAGALFDTPIVNQPEVAILGTGALVKRPVVVTNEFGEDTIAIRDMMYLSLSYDHRLIDGAVAARFLSGIKARLEEGDFAGEF
ncbi:2-oxo acid dehydrogenase subunit E2 [Cutibacterium avidum]|uniref:2-oxo acid dehydrogenase subunit E2 n=1 Tax=Cutibacterium avidum TaxID=33010 RepID=UPI00226415BB|nr:2-oxo acid dehydrogenase subunit E2 [Cutibacterium avidum]MCX8466929.1 2-oxo acid dehydrogenase subunit E2 [Cutibacterium avidum]